MTTISSNNMNVEGPKDPVGGPSVTVPSSATPANALPSSATNSNTPTVNPSKNSTLEKLANIKATTALNGSTKVLRLPVSAPPQKPEADPKPVDLKAPRMLSSNAPKLVSSKELEEIGAKMDFCDVEEEVEADPKPVKLKPPRMLTSNEPKNLSSKDLEEIGAKMDYCEVEEEVEADPKAVELKNPRMLTTKQSTFQDPAWNDADKLRPLPPNPMGRSSDATINKMYESVQRQLDVLNNLKDVSKQVEAKLDIKIDLPAKRSMAEQGKLGAWTVENFDVFVDTLKADLANNQLKDYAEILRYMNTL